MEVLSEHNCEGWLEGYTLTGRHGLFATYEAFAMVSASMTVQHTKWLEEGSKLPWREADPVAERPPHLDVLAERPQRLQPPGAGPDRRRCSPRRAPSSRIYLPPDANCLLSVADHCLRSRNYVNLIVIDKQPQLQWLDIDEAIAALRARERRSGRGRATSEGGEPDVVLAAAGDVPTLEVVAAAWWLRRHAPELNVRVVNVVDLMTPVPAATSTRTGWRRTPSSSSSTRETDVVFAFHGYQRAIHADRPRAAARRALPRARLQRGRARRPRRSTWWC